MNQLEYIQRISKYLSRFSEQVDILNKVGDFSINIYAENLLVRILNRVYGLDLINANSQNVNYSAIDLLDVNSKISFQITATKRIEKIKDSIEKFFRNGVYKHAKELNFYILTGKQQTYSLESINKKIEEEVELLQLGQGNLQQDTALIFSIDCIKDRSDILKKLVDDNDFEKIKDIEKILREQFDKIDETINLSDYYKKLKNSFYDVVMDDEKGLTLDQIYVEPSFALHEKSFKKNDQRIPEKHEKFIHADYRYTIHEFMDDSLKGDNPLGTAMTHNFFLILGYPGQGKSSFCKKFLNDYIVKGQIKKQDVYYFQLRNIRQVKDFINDPLGVLYEEACETVEYNLNKFSFNKSLLVLDGLDELYMRENLRIDDIDKLCTELIRLQEKHIELKIILTSRYGYIDDEKLNREKLLIIQLVPFKLISQLKWLNTYSKYHPETWLTEQKLKAFNKEDNFSHIKELIEQPLLLHMIASINYEIDEKTNRAKIYQQLFSELIERRYSKDGQLEIFKNISKEDLRDLIREVAFAIFNSGEEYITKTELLKLEATQKFLTLLPEDGLRESIKGVMISFYFKEVNKSEDDIWYDDRHNYAIEFLHKSLQEYMTAEKIFYTLSTEFLDKRKNGKYIIDDSKQALEFINYIFGKSSLTDEIKAHLMGIIENETEIDKTELNNRLLLYLDDFSTCDFVSKCEMVKHESPFDISFRSFFGVWFIASCLGLEKNYLINGHIKVNFVNYLNFMSSSNAETVERLDFSFQDLSDLAIHNISFINCKFYKTNFSNARLNNLSFSFSSLDEAIFDKTQIHKIDLFQSNLNRVDFKSCRIRSLELFSSGLSKCRFDNTSLYDITQLKFKANDAQMVTFDQCNFHEVFVDEVTMKLLKENEMHIDLSSVKVFDKKLSDFQFDNPGTEQMPEKRELPSNYKRLVL